MLDIPASFSICTAQECRDLDAYTIDNFGISGFTLMEIAGAKSAQHILKEIPYRARALVLCGKGNNAGDALVIARHLFRNGISSIIVFLMGTENLSPSTQRNFELLNQFNEIYQREKESSSIHFIDSWDKDLIDQQSFDFIIDGMLGTGISSEIRGDFRKAIEWANQSGLPIYAMDIPTGLHTDSGEELGIAIHACKTFTFGMLKTGFYFNEGPKVSGDVVYVDLGFPHLRQNSSKNYLIDESWINIQETPQHTVRHKYEAGVLYIIAGSEGLTGAAMLAAKSAWAEGLGAVIMIMPRGLTEIFETNLIQQVKHPVGQRDDYWFKPEHVTDIKNFIGMRKGTILLGPGLGRHQETITFVHNLLDHQPGNIVIDADGLWCLAQLNEWPDHSLADWILTPHPGELKTLTGKEVDNPYIRMTIAREFSLKEGITTISKGMPSIVSNSFGQCFITNYDTTIFARSGFGDVLAGKTAAKRALDYSTSLSSIMALIDGKKKYDNFVSTNPIHKIEPLNLI